jgi:hypothetical protein
MFDIDKAIGFPSRQRLKALAVPMTKPGNARDVAYDQGRRPGRAVINQAVAVVNECPLLCA